MFKIDDGWKNDSAFSGAVVNASVSQLFSCWFDSFLSSY